MTISRLLLHLAVLLGVLLVHYGEAATYQDFVNKHIDYPISIRTGENLNAYCNRMMQERGLNPWSCKSINDFINEDPTLIEAVCGRDGIHYQGNLYDSKRRFRTVKCRNTGRFPNCNYNGRSQTKKVRLGCLYRLPVHFEPSFG